MGKRIAGINLAKNGSLVILQNGEIEFYLEEERVTRIKRDISAKTLADKYIDSSIDALTICDCFTRYTRQTYLERTRAKNELCKIAKSRGCLSIVDYRDRHHECHAANAFYNSGFDDAVCVVMDGKGSFHTDDSISQESGYGDAGVALRYAEIESIYDYSGEFIPLFKHYSTFWSEEESDLFDEPYWHKGNLYSDRTSIGQAFRRVSRYCRFDEIEAGKTMGLSAYGHPDTPVNLFNEEYNHSLCSKDLYVSGNTTEYHGPKLRIEDLAYNLQKSAEKHAVFMIKKAVEMSGKKNVVVSGGFFLNCAANQSIIKELDVNLYVDPISYDGGIAIGSALLLHYEHLRNRS